MTPAPGFGVGPSTPNNAIQAPLTPLSIQGQIQARIKCVNNQPDFSIFLLVGSSPPRGESFKPHIAFLSFMRVFSSAPNNLSAFADSLTLRPRSLNISLQACNAHFPRQECPVSLHTICQFFRLVRVIVEDVSNAPFDAFRSWYLRTTC